MKKDLPTCGKLAIVLVIGAGAAGAMLACTETVRTNYEDADAASDGGAVNLPRGDAPYDASPAPGDAAAPELDDVPIVCKTTPCVVQLEHGDEHFCARMSDGTVRCWGGDVYGVGTLGSVPPADAGKDAAPWGSLPVPVKGLAAVDELSVDEGTGCARTDGGIACWGNNTTGQLALAKTDPAIQDSDPHPTPRAVALPSKVDAVTVGTFAVCAQLADGGLWCWGLGPGSSLLRTPDDLNAYVPAPSTIPADVGTLLHVRTGVYNAFGITSTGALVSWGSGILGYTSSLPTSPPDRITGIADEVVSMTTNGYQACAIGKTDPARPPVTSRLWCWGNNEAGQLGNGVQDSRDVPTSVEILVNEPVAAPQKASTAFRETCIRMTSGSVYCAGNNLHGRLGRPVTTVLSAIFVQIPDVKGAASVAVGRSTSCALLQTGEVQCWGGNELGQLGIGTRDTLAHPSPSRVTFPP